MNKDKPRILWITHSPLTEISFGQVSNQLLKRMSGTYDFLVPSFSYSGIPLPHHGYTIVPFENSSHLSFYLKQFKPDLIVLFHSYFALDKLSEESFNGVPSILYLPVEALRVPKEFHDSIRRFDKIITTSKYSKKILAKDRFESEVVYHGVDKDFFIPVDRPKKDKTIFGYLGILDARKNLPELLKAYSKVKIKKELYLASPMRYGNQDLSSFCKLLEIAPLFEESKALGLPIASDKVLAFYKKLDCFIGVGSEGFGLPALECGATGAANIALNAGAAPEILGNSALYVKSKGIQKSQLGDLEVVDVNDLIQKMEQMGDITLRQKLGDAGIRQAEKFSWDDSVHELDRIIWNTLKLK